MIKKSTSDHNYEKIGRFIELALSIGYAALMIRLFPIAMKLMDEALK